MRLRPSAFVAAAALFAALTAVIQPWGDYPTNDDWQYARVARRLALTHTLEIDVPIAPSLVGQVVLVAPLIRAFGFSHTLLRLTTVLCSLALLFLIDRLLAIAGLGARQRFVALATLVVNPLFVNLSLSFMTEIYGYVPALLGAWLWLRERRRQDEGAARAFRPWAAIGVGVLCGVSFWTRQYAVLVLPALWAGACLRFAGERPRAGLRALVAPVCASLVSAGIFVAGYFLWARQSGSLRPEFERPLAQLARLDLDAWAAESGMVVIFLGLSCLPVLLLALGNRGGLLRREVVGGILIASLCLMSAMHFRTMIEASPQLDFFMGHHSSFPFVGNVFSQSGIGPITLTDVYFLGAPGHPRWVAWLWGTLVVVAISSSMLWALLLPGGKLRGRRRGAIRREVIGFGATLSVTSFAVAVQAYGVLLFDRYYFPCLLGAAVATAARLLPSVHEEGAHLRARPFVRIAWPAATLALVGLGVVTVAGVHNYFRWNDARWSLYRTALAMGADPRTIDGGYEVQGWHALDLLKLPMDERRCIGPCACERGWYCLDNSYQIAMNRPPSSRIVEERQPAYWLAEGPPLLLTRRPEPGSSP